MCFSPNMSVDRWHELDPKQIEVTRKPQWRCSESRTQTQLPNFIETTFLPTLLLVLKAGISPSLTGLWAHAQCSECVTNPKFQDTERKHESFLFSALIFLLEFMFSMSIILKYMCVCRLILLSKILRLTCLWSVRPSSQSDDAKKGGKKRKITSVTLQMRILGNTLFIVELPAVLTMLNPIYFLIMTISVHFHFSPAHSFTRKTRNCIFKHQYEQKESI